MSETTWVHRTADSISAACATGRRGSIAYSYNTRD
jgi:hypothetical protein